MGGYLGQVQAVTLHHLLKKKKQGEKIAMITCYDSAFARLVDQTDIDIVLVGDSLGNVVLGFDNTLPVSMEHMLHHTAAVARGLRRAFLVADMPLGSYQVSEEAAVANAIRLVKEANAHAVKVEGGEPVLGAVERIVKAGVPVMAHLGLTPQSVHALGGYRVQGREEKARKKLLAEARRLEDAGAFALVLELVPEDLAKEVTAALGIPTIGIGAGRFTDGQVLVLHDMLGFNPDFQPKFLKRYATMGDTIREAVSAYCKDVKEGSFPTSDHVF